MKPTEGANGDRVAKNPAQSAVRRILNWPEPVAVLEQRPPRSDFAMPRLEGISGAGLGFKEFTAPTVVVAANPEHLDPGVVEIGDGRDHTETGLRHDMSPGEPEVEEIAHDHERPRASGKMAQKGQQRPLNVFWGDAEVGIADEVTGSQEHGGSLTSAPTGHKPCGSS